MIPYIAHVIKKIMIEKSIILVTAIIFGTTVGLTPILVQLQQASSFIQRIADAPLASSGDNVYVVWSSNKTGNWEILFRASIDGGKTFGDKINLSNSTNANSAHPDISASGNNVHVSFHDNKTGSVDTYAITSTDKGKTFGDIVAINGTGTMPQKTKIVTIPGLDILGDSEENTQVSSSGNSVYVVSWDKKAGNWEVFLARSTDNGKTFGPLLKLATNDSLG